MKLASIALTLLLAAALTGCGGGGTSAVMEPVGDGLRFLGVSAVVAALAVVLARSLEGGDS